MRARLQLHRAANPGQRGEVSAGLALGFPLLLMLIFGTLEFALWQHAQHVAVAAAQEGARAARTEQGSAAAGQARAEAFLAELAPGALSEATVTVARGADQVEVVIDGHTSAGLFDLTLPVRARVHAPVEQFRPDLGPTP